jgi:uncharacterized protein YydD (DUF2326 family)
MLAEISCELFKIGEQKRPPIRFHKGLNIILGGEAGANSIGKSTMLLIIDFAFGGEAYVKSDAVRELGNHNIHFTFEFDGKPYYFVRHTASPDDVFRLDKDRNILGSLKKDEYVNWIVNPKSDRNYKVQVFLNSVGDRYPSVPCRRMLLNQCT